MNFNGCWALTTSAIPQTKCIRIEAACEALNLRVGFDVPALEALRFALGILKTYGTLDPAIAEPLDERVSNFEQHVIERVS